MHELSIANSILEGARARVQAHSGERLSKIGVRIGDLAGIDPDALTFCFDALVKETDLEKCALEIERIPQRHQCRDCGQGFTIENFHITCPACGSNHATFVCGNELEFAYLEMEET